MRVLVYPHDLGIGGSQLNAVELADAVHRAGHDVVVFGRPGALVDRIEQLGLEFIEAPESRHRPSRSVQEALVGLIDRRGIDVLHGYEWPPSLECILAARRRRGVATVTTVMSMAVAPFIPRRAPLVVGTAQIEAGERASGRTEVSLIEPPVDLRENGPDLDVGSEEFAQAWQLDDGRLNVVMVTRLATELKLEGILAAADAIGRLSTATPVRLVIVGDGPAREIVRERARAVNARYGEGTIVLAGELRDPRPAYALADIALGMGGSALRAMAFAKPLIVQGERGFWETLAPETVDTFLWQGWYGVAADAHAGSATLEARLRPLLDDPGLRRSLGEFGRDLVERRFSLDRAAQTQIGIYERALTASARGPVRVDTGSFARFARYHLERRVHRVFGGHRVDDFNSKPVVARAAESVPSSPPASTAGASS